MSQVDQALQRAAYDIGYKGELIGVLEAEVLALREGRTADADMLRRAREAALAPPVAADETAGITDAPAPGPPDDAPGRQPAAEAEGRKSGAEATADNDDRDGEPVERR
jgi:hypothetical protein